MTRLATAKLSRVSSRDTSADSMSHIPSKCPRCGKNGLWREEINPFRAGIPTGFGRIRIGFVSKGLFSGLIKRKLGLNKVTYRCRRCGFKRDYEK